MPVVVISRESSSGTYDFFKEHVLLNQDFLQSSILMPSADAITQVVSQIPGAIGYVGLGYISENVKPVKVSFDKGASFIEPSIESVVQNTYPITRPLFYYYLAENETKIGSFIEFSLSPASQEIVKDVGYINVR